MLTHSGLAREQGYEALAKALGRNERFVKREDPHMAYFMDRVEPLGVAFAAKRYGEAFRILGTGNGIGSLADKKAFQRDLERLVELRATGTVGAVMEHLSISQLPRVPEEVRRREALLASGTATGERDVARVDRLRKLHAVPYSEVVAATRFVEEQTPFATKHGVKGAEFDDVLVVIGRGWEKYDFGALLEKLAQGEALDEGGIRNRNLFYVACSRSKNRLVLLFTQELSPAAMGLLKDWFGEANVRPAPG